MKTVLRDVLFVTCVLVLGTALAVPATSFGGGVLKGPKGVAATTTTVSVVFELATDEGAVAREVSRRARARRAGTPVAPLTLAKVTARYGASAADIGAVKQWAGARGLAARPNAARTHVMVRGSATRMGRALGVSLRRYRRAGVRPYVAARSRPAVPVALRGSVESVTGLSHFLPSHRPPRSRSVPPRAGSNGLVASGWDCATSHFASDVAYAGFFPATPLGTVAPYGYTAVGSSTSSPPQLVVAGLAGVTHVPNQADVNAYVKACRFDKGPTPVPTSVAVDDTGIVPLPQEPAGTQSEQGMDVSILATVAPPNAQVAFYGGTDAADHPTADLLSALVARAGVPVSAANPRLTVVSLSLDNQESPGYADWEAGNDKLLARLGIMGVSVLASSGDWGSQGAPANEGDGSWSCAYTGLVSVNWPASSPYATGVGGTMWGDSARPLASESTWSEGTGCGESASGGGQSMWYGVPSLWPSQSVAGTNGRNVPDLSMLAGQPGFIRQASNQWGWSGGTSAAAPFVAAGVARLNADRMAAGKKPLGFLNPIIYALPATAFNDVSVGSNDLWGVGCCTAGPGYDMTTGLGSPLLGAPAWGAVP